LTIKASTDTATGHPKLTWNTAEEIRYYQLYRSESEDGTYEKLGNMTVTTKVDSTAETGKTYWYKVRVIDTNSKSGSYSEPVSIVCKPGKVTGVKTTVVSSTGKPKVTWTAVDDAVKYQVYYCTSKTGTYKRLATTANTSYTHSKAEAGTTYYYKVRAMSENGTYGTFSTIISGTAE
jgi:fibronectin type 3 domain-containing protein